MYLVFDIGGSSTKIAYINGQGQIVEKDRLPALATVDEFKNMLRSIVAKALIDYQIKGVGMASPGRVDSRTGEVLGLSALGYLDQFNFAKDIQDKFGLPVAILNDANAAALSEMHFAKVKEKNVCFFIIGSGVGGAIIQDGQLMLGRRAEAGEFGYMYVKREYDKVFNLSQMATLPNAVRRLREKHGIISNAKELLDFYFSGKEPYYQVVEEAFYYLCVGLYNVQYALDPDIIYIGGAISQNRQYIEEIKRILGHPQFSEANIKIRPVTYYNDNNLLGAYAHLRNQMKEGRRLCTPSE